MQYLVGIWRKPCKTKDMVVCTCVPDPNSVLVGTISTATIHNLLAPMVAMLLSSALDAEEGAKDFLLVTFSFLAHFGKNIFRSFTMFRS